MLISALIRILAVFGWARLAEFSLRQSFFLSAVGWLVWECFSELSARPIVISIQPLWSNIFETLALGDHGGDASEIVDYPSVTLVMLRRDLLFCTEKADFRSSPKFTQDIPKDADMFSQFDFGWRWDRDFELDLLFTLKPSRPGDLGDMSTPTPAARAMRTLTGAGYKVNFLGQIELSRLPGVVIRAAFTEERGWPYSWLARKSRKQTERQLIAAGWQSDDYKCVWSTKFVAVSVYPLD